jgi:hypothetical protein
MGTDLDRRPDARISLPCEDIFPLDVVRRGSRDHDVWLTVKLQLVGTFRKYGTILPLPYTSPLRAIVTMGV